MPSNNHATEGASEAYRALVFEDLFRSLRVQRSIQPGLFLAVIDLDDPAMKTRRSIVF